MCFCVFVFQYDFVELLDGSRLISKDKRALSDADVSHPFLSASHDEESATGSRHARSVNVHEAGFIHYLDTGIWHLAFYNDGRNTEQVSYNTIVIGVLQPEMSVCLCWIVLIYFMKGQQCNGGSPVNSVI